MTSLLEQAARKVGVKGLLSGLTPGEQEALLYDWRLWARPSQLPPPGDWLTWLIMTGRGWGKTRVGAETVRTWIEGGEASRIALVGRTPADVRDTMVEGESGILACCPPRQRPVYEPTKRKLTWQNGATALTFTSYEPDQLRGPQFERIWWDELQSFQYLRETWNNGQLALRLGKPRQIITMTPRPVGVLKEIIANSTTVLTRGTTYENRANLSPAFYDQIVSRYEGTTLGQAEIYGLLLEDVPGALWTRSLLDRTRVPAVPDGVSLVRVFVGVDPPGGVTECGIVCAGRGSDGHFYVLADRSRKATPDAWAGAVIDCYEEYSADRVVAERNFGGDMVESTIRQAAKSRGRYVSFKPANASRGKTIRAQPVVAMYEQGRVHHVGSFPDLEDEQCLWVDGETRESPNRLDALVWAVTELMPSTEKRVTFLEG